MKEKIRCGRLNDLPWFLRLGWCAKRLGSDFWESIRGKQAKIGGRFECAHDCRHSATLPLLSSSRKCLSFMERERLTQKRMEDPDPDLFLPFLVSPAPTPNPSRSASPLGTSSPQPSTTTLDPQNPACILYFFCWDTVVGSRKHQVANGTPKLSPVSILPICMVTSAIFLQGVLSASSHRYRLD